MAQAEKSIDTSRLGHIRQKLGRNLPPGWELTTLGEALKWGSGGTPKRNDPRYYEGAIPWLIIGDLNDGVVLDSETRITEDGLRNSSAKWVEPGSVLLAMYGSIGKLGIAGKRLTTNQAIAFTKPDPIDAKYLFYFLMFTRGDLASLGKGATQKNISQTVIKAFPFVLAPQTQQARIVAEIEKQFSRLDEAVANLKRVQANFKRYKATVLKAAVEGKLTEDWRKQHPEVEPAEKLLERILAERRAEWNGKGTYRDPEAPEDHDLPKLPPGWIWATSLQVFKEVKDGTHDTPKYQEKGVPFITQKHIKPAGLVFSDFKLISEVDHEQFYRRSNPERGDILVSMIGVNRGQSCIVSTDAIFSIKNVGLFKPNCFLTSNKFLQLYFSSLVGQKLILRSSKGGAQPFIGLTELRAWPLPLPPFKEQHLIVAEAERRLSVIDELEATVKANLTRADRLRKSILSEAFCGKLLGDNIVGQV